MLVAGGRHVHALACHRDGAMNNAAIWFARDYSRGGARDEHPAMLFRTFAVHIVKTHAQRAMSKTLIFLGSATAAKSQAKALAAALQSTELEFLPWWEAFTPGRTLLEELDAIRGKVQGALLVFSPDAESVVRGKAVQTVNPNVLFEFGYFYGYFRKEKVALVKYGEYYTPSDFGGYIHIAGSKSFKRSGAVKVAQRTETEFKRWVDSAGFAAAASKVSIDEAEETRKAQDAARFRASRGYLSP
jgi:hypothetical protein